MTETKTPVEQPTAEEIARHYSAAMDSVNLEFDIVGKYLARHLEKQKQ